MSLPHVPCWEVVTVAETAMDRYGNFWLGKLLERQIGDVVYLAGVDLTSPDTVRSRVLGLSLATRSVERARRETTGPIFETVERSEINVDHLWVGPYREIDNGDGLTEACREIEAACRTIEQIACVHTGRARAEPPTATEAAAFAGIGGRSPTALVVGDRRWLVGPVGSAGTGCWRAKVVEVRDGRARPVWWQRQPHRALEWDDRERQWRIPPEVERVVEEYRRLDAGTLTSLFVQEALR